ncbi:MAG: outer membrane protein transport protein [Pseudomonadota bacterium]|nr:outer membrane protein transport protein [Pseudomonadota bacterium]
MAHKLSYFTITILASASFNCFAAGFQISEQSASSLGNAFAGTSAVIEDASIVFFNPAGTTFLNSGQFSLSGTVINVNSDVEFTSSTFTNPLLGTRTISGNDREDAGGWFAVPAMYIALPFTACCNRFAVGLGITAPWGLISDYTTSAKDRYLATYSRLSVINIGPTLAWQPTSNFSLGAGFDAQYLDTVLRQQVVAINPVTGAQLQDSSLENNANDWAYGWNAGAIFHIPQSGTTIGAAYRSRVTHSPEGDASLVVPVLQTTFAGRVESDVSMPEIATLSLVQEICCLTLIGSVSWTHWDVIQDIGLQYGGAIAQPAPGFPGIPGATLAVNYENSWRYAVAVNYKADPSLKFRAGVMWDQTPVQTVDTEIFRLPDNDRLWVAVGANFRVNNMFNIDAGYSHLFIDNFQMNQSAILGGTTTFNTRANVVASSNIFAMQFNVNFC